MEATNCSDDKDYLEFYDMSLHYYHRLRKRDPFMARYCGWTYPAPNLTDALTQRYFTFLWRTDGSREDKGWRVMATRVYPGEATTLIFMTPTLEKLNIAFGSSVRASVRASVTKFIKIQF